MISIKVIPILQHIVKYWHIYLGFQFKIQHFLFFLKISLNNIINISCQDLQWYQNMNSFYLPEWNIYSFVPIYFICCLKAIWLKVEKCLRIPSHPLPLSETDITAHNGHLFHTRWWKKSSYLLSNSQTQSRVTKIFIIYENRI